MTSSNGNIFRVTGPLYGEFTVTDEFPSQRPVTRSFDVFFDLRLNQQLSKQSRGWWFETPLCPLWRHRTVMGLLLWADELVSRNKLKSCRPTSLKHCWFYGYTLNRHCPRVTWWRHQIETFSVLLALCVGNSPVTGEFRTQRPDFLFSLICASINGWVNNSGVVIWDAIAPIMTLLQCMLHAAYSLSRVT